jgi:hypothetical protein
LNRSRGVPDGRLTISHVLDDRTSRPDGAALSNIRHHDRTIADPGVRPNVNLLKTPLLRIQQAVMAVPAMLSTPAQDIDVAADHHPVRDIDHSDGTPRSDVDPLANPDVSMRKERSEPDRDIAPALLESEAIETPPQEHADLAWTQT